MNIIKQIFLFTFLLLLFSQCAKKNVDELQADKKSVNEEWRGNAPGAAAARAIELGEYTNFDLPNGLKVIVVENHKIPRVSYQISFNSDPIIEGDQAGYVTMAGDMLNKGTTSKSKAELDEEIDYIGASLATNSFGIFGSSLKKHSVKLLDLMTDMLYNPSFPEDELEKLRRRTLSGLATSKTDASAIANNIAAKVNFGENHPYGEISTELTVKNITIDKCKQYYNDYFKPNNAYLVIVGDISPKEAQRQVEKYFSKWERGVVPVHQYEKPKKPLGRVVSFGNKEGAVQSVINITYPVEMNPGNPDVIQASTMNSILGGGIFTSRLMQNLREKKAYTYGARSNISNDKLIGDFSASANVRNEVTDSSIQEFLYEFERIVSEPVSEKDLLLSKNSLAGNFARSLESPQTIANFALNTFRYNLPKDYYNTYLQKLEAITVNDIQNMAKKYIQPNNCNIVVVGNKEQVSEKLIKFDSDGKIDFYDAYGNLLKDEVMEIADGVTAQTVVEDFLTATGGKEKLLSIQNLTTTMEAELMGQKASFETIQAKPDKFAMKVMMMGMTVQEQIFNGTKALQGQMGQKQVFTEGEEFNSLKKEARIIEQLNYLGGEYKLSLKGIENVENEPCYKLFVTNADGESVTEYFSIKTGLLMRKIQVQEANGESIIITNDYSNYKDVGGGILMPHKISLTGAIPMPIVMEATSIQINKLISADIFNIE